jgi:hypothetical protein
MESARDRRQLIGKRGCNLGTPEETDLVWAICTVGKLVREVLCPGRSGFRCTTIPHRS